MKQLRYALSTKLALPLEPAIAATRPALKADGLDVLTEREVTS